ncbi:hypothetical protein OKW76_03270 [Sphingomonas sp. S1-29]|uniref:hypothetical protein n=1 Tax=Sphingomonas sp. S1-29 TaxID=2991074 RepID=UPI0022407386|nr:hypothetical protein [Sphingomonas sp. S1-29]UZK70086.1 hypothetical protein OKW76_03270 [Sphingomonas sp. S1-29]
MIALFDTSVIVCLILQESGYQRAASAARSFRSTEFSCARRSPVAWCRYTPLKSPMPEND